VTLAATSDLELVRDFVNTYEVESHTDSLATRASLTRWLAAHGIAGRAELAEAIEVREALRELLLANNLLPADVDAASRVLDRAARRAGLGVRFADGDAHVRARGGLGGLLAAVSRAMASDDWSRLKACRAEDCHWAFVDQARNRSRAWCDMKVCGNREKAQRFRERRATAG
jgi:predicted RNA-binding Zn ribbon-like protein